MPCPVRLLGDVSPIHFPFPQCVSKPLSAPVTNRRSGRPINVPVVFIRVYLCSSVVPTAFLVL